MGRFGERAGLGFAAFEVFAQRGRFAFQAGGAGGFGGFGLVWGLAGLAGHLPVEANPGGGCNPGGAG